MLRVDSESSFLTTESFRGWTLWRNPWLRFLDRLRHIMRRARILIAIRKNVLGLGILLTRMIA